MKFKTTSNLNVRSGPGKMHPLLRELSPGTIVEDLLFQDWCQIAPDQWVSRDFLKPFIELPEPLYLTIARGELGVKEIYGNGSNPRIIEYHQTCSLKATSDAIPWCSAFLNFCITQSGLQGTNSAAAISWMQWGEAIPLAQGEPGDVAVFARTGGNHVGFHLSHDDNAIRLLAGNQSDEVNIATCSRARFLGLRRPVVKKVEG